MSRMRQLLIAVLSWAVAPSIVLALTLPAVQGYVSDFAELLNEADRAALEEQLRVFAEQTSTEISVVTVVSLEGETIEYYAGKLFEAWQVGQQKIDNGVLLLVAPNEREVRIEVGYGLEGALPDALAHRIIQDDILPAFRAGDYTTGIQRGVTAIISVTKGEYTASSEASPSTAEAIEGWFFVIIFGLQFGLAIMARTKSWWLGGIFGALIALVIALIVQSVISFVALSAILVPFGFFIDYAVSEGYRRGKARGHIPWYAGGNGGGRSSGGFGGFSGGRSGGGGASGRW